VKQAAMPDLKFSAARIKTLFWTDTRYSSRDSGLAALSWLSSNSLKTLEPRAGIEPAT